MKLKICASHPFALVNRTFPLSHVRAAWRLAPCSLRGQLIISPLLCHLQQRKQQFDYSLTYLWAAANRGWFVRERTPQYIEGETHVEFEFEHARSAVHPTMCAADTQGMCHPQLYNNAGGWCKFLSLPPGQQTYLVRERRSEMREMPAAAAAPSPPSRAHRAHGVVGILKLENLFIHTCALSRRHTTRCKY